MGMAEVERAVVSARGHSKSFFAGPRGEALVATAEAALGVELPPSYRRFVVELGAGSVGAREFYGVIDDDFVESSVPDGIWLTLSERKQLSLPKPLVIVGEDGMGGYYVLDTSQRDAVGESPVVIWTPGGAGLEVVAPDFGTFFLRAVEEELGAA